MQLRYVLSPVMVVWLAVHVEGGAQSAAAAAALIVMQGMMLITFLCLFEYLFVQSDFCR